MSSSEIISPPIIDDGGPPNDQVIWSWFDWGTSAQYPKNVFIDHEMKVFHIEEIDLDVDQVNYYITQMLDAMPEAVSGCIDSQACNYNPEATQDDESCEYPETNYDCDDNCIGVDIDQDGVCDVDDICPNIYDPWQSDYDNDQLADACEDTDDDNDGNDDCWNLAVGTYIPGNFDSILYFDENSQQLTQNEIAALIASGVCEDTQLAIDNTSIPNDINLLSVYPNPFNPSSNITFFINTPQIITLSIYNLDGQKISNLASEFYNSGHHEIKWSPDISISSGLYIVRLEARNSAINHKLLYLK